MRRWGFFRVKVTSKQVVGSLETSLKTPYIHIKYTHTVFALRILQRHASRQVPFSTSPHHSYKLLLFFYSSYLGTINFCEFIHLVMFAHPEKEFIQRISSVVSKTHFFASAENFIFSEIPQPNNIISFYYFKIQQQILQLGFSHRSSSIYWAQRLKVDDFQNPSNWT